MQDLETKIRIALGELGATWEDPEIVIKNILATIDKEIFLAVEQEKKRMVDRVNELTAFRIGVGQDPLISKDSVLTLINNK